MATEKAIGEEEKKRRRAKVALWRKEWKIDGERGKEGRDGSSCLHAKIVEGKGGVEEEGRTNCTFLASIGKIGVTAWVFFAQIFFFWCRNIWEKKFGCRKERKCSR